MVARLSFKKAWLPEAFHVRPIFFPFLCLGSVRRILQYFDQRGSYGGVVLDIPRIIVGEPQEPLELSNIIRFVPTLKRQHFPWRRPVCAIFQHMATKFIRMNKEIGFANRSNQLFFP